jgi:lipoprotein-releasing system permease protein
MKTFALLIQISKALMQARWKQTLVAAFGVLFSIAMFITLLGFMNGLNAMLDGLILNRTPHVRLYNEIKTRQQPIDQANKDSSAHHFISSIKPSLIRKEIYNSASIIESIKLDPRVLGVAPKVMAQVFYTIGAIELTGVVNGVDPEAENKLFHFSEYVTSGNYQDLNNIPNSIILGKGLAEKLMASIGDQVYITTAQGERFALKVVGYFQSGIADLDKVNSYASIQTTQKILVKNSNYLSDIQVKLYDINQAPFIAKEYAQKYTTDAEDIQTANAQFETGSDVRSIISYAVGITLLIVAGFGIYNILNMMIYEKMDTIAILKATGFSGADVKNIFLIIALSIGLVGGIGGLIVGLGLSMIIDNIPFITAALPTITTFPIDYNPKYYIIASTFALVTTYLAGLFPARKASSVDPVVIIRGK